MQQELLFAVPDHRPQDARTIADEAVAMVLVERKKYPALMRRHVDDWACTDAQFEALDISRNVMDRAALRGDAVAAKTAARIYREAWRIVLKAAGSAEKGET